MRGIPGTLSFASASPQSNRYGLVCFIPPRSFCCAATRLFSTTFFAFGDGGDGRGLRTTSNTCHSSSGGHVQPLSIRIWYAPSLLRSSRFDRLGDDVRDAYMVDEDVWLSKSRRFSCVSAKSLLKASDRGGGEGRGARRVAGGGCWDGHSAGLSERARFLSMDWQHLGKVTRPKTLSQYIGRVALSGRGDTNA